MTDVPQMGQQAETCRICLESSTIANSSTGSISRFTDVEDEDRLISPCACSGTRSLIHLQTMSYLLLLFKVLLCFSLCLLEKFLSFLLLFLSSSSSVNNYIYTVSTRSSYMSVVQHSLSILLVSKSSSPCSKLHYYSEFYVTQVEDMLDIHF